MKRQNVVNKVVIQNLDYSVDIIVANAEKYFVVNVVQVMELKENVQTVKVIQFLIKLYLWRVLTLTLNLSLFIVLFKN